VFDHKEYSKSYREKTTTIAISNENYFLLKNLGKTGDSFNDVLSKLLKTQDTKN